MPVGAQEFEIIGSKVHFQRDPKADNPLVDLGVIRSISPSISAEKVELKDPWGGLSRTVAQGSSTITESYQVVCANVNMYNFALALLGAKPADFTQSATETTAAFKAFKGNLAGVVDGVGTRIHNMTTVIGLSKGTTTTKAIYGTGVAVDAAAKKIILSGDQTAVTGLAPGKAIMVNSAGLVNKANAKSYTISTRTLVSGQTELVVLESPAANETTLVGATITHENAGTIYLPGVDWEVVDLVLGTVRIKSGGAITDLDTINMTYLPAAISGKRLVYPQTAPTIEGEISIYLGSQGGANVKVRNARCSITPDSPTFEENGFATVGFTLTILSDPNNTTAPAGRFLHFIGAVPDAS